MPTDLLERMRANPAGDWRIRDVEAIVPRIRAQFPLRQGHVACPCAPSLGARDLDHPGASADQASLHSQARALY